jgi:hypothetical protein
MLQIKLKKARKLNSKQVTSGPNSVNVCILENRYVELRGRGVWVCSVAGQRPTLPPPGGVKQRGVGLRPDLAGTHGHWQPGQKKNSGMCMTMLFRQPGWAWVASKQCLKSGLARGLTGFAGIWPAWPRLSLIFQRRAFLGPARQMAMYKRVVYVMVDRGGCSK